jgi:hypothetical protein
MDCLEGCEVSYLRDRQNNCFVYYTTRILVTTQFANAQCRDAWAHLTPDTNARCTAMTIRPYNVCLSV